MLSRGKQQAAKHPTAQGSPEDCGVRRTRAGVIKLSRGPRGTAAAVTRKHLPEAVNHKVDEIRIDKTPKRLPKNNQWTSTFSSPCNEEPPQEIFWDPQSPMPYKSDNEKRKRTGKSTVEISDIVKRIAPQDEKPTSSEVALLGMWIGENAIPCTPGVGIVRTRSKLSCTKHKIKNTEEELMKLAKQFDQNLIDAIQEQDHQEPAQIFVGGELITDHGESGNLDTVHFLPDKMPERDITACLNAAKHSSVTPTSEECQNSQKSVDQETEAAFNALFDSSTQKCSGSLSQGLSDSSQKSSQGTKYLTGVDKDIDLKAASHVQQGAHISNVKQHSATPFLVEDHNQIPERNTSNIVQKQDAAPTTKANACNPAISVSTDQDEFEDWGTDLFEDDSFLMQITQNPELVKTPQHKMSPSKLSSKPPKAIEEVKDIVMNGCKTSPLSKASHFQFMPSEPFKAGNCANDREGTSANRSDFSIMEGSDLQNTNSFKSVGMCSYKTNTQSKPPTLTPKIVHKPALKKTKESLQPLHIPNIHVTRTDFHSNFVTSPKPHNTQTRPSAQSAVCFSLSRLSSCSSQKKTNNLEQSLVKQANDSNPISSTLHTKNSISSDDWDDPKFSDEILNMFCESDSLFEANEEDDLLYQVCDDIERLTQTAATKKGNEKCETQPGNVVSKLDPSKGLVVPKRAPGYNQLVQSKPLNRSTFSLNPMFSKKNTCSTDQVATQSNINSTHLKAVTSNLPSGSKYSISQNSGNKNDQLQEKFRRTHSTPAESFSSVSHTKLENNVKPPSSSSVNKTLAAQPPQKFSFTKLKTSQMTAVHIDRNSSQSESVLCTEAYRPFREGKALTNVSLHGNLPASRHQSLKRQLLESFLQPTKVLTAEERTQKCSQEEIERKKLEALERLKKRTQSRLKDT